MFVFISFLMFIFIFYSRKLSELGSRLGFPFGVQGLGPRPPPCRRATGRPKVGIPFETYEDFSCSTGCLDSYCSGRLLGGPKAGPGGVQMCPERNLKEVLNASK